MNLQQEAIKEDSFVLQAKRSQEMQGGLSAMFFVTNQAGSSSLPWASPPEVNTAMALPTPRVLAAWCSSWVMIHSRIQENDQLRHSWIKVLRALAMAPLGWIEPPQSGSPTILSLGCAA